MAKCDGGLWGGWGVCVEGRWREGGGGGGEKTRPGVYGSKRAKSHTHKTNAEFYDTACEFSG